MLMMLVFRTGKLPPQAAGGAANADDAGFQARGVITAGRSSFG